MEVAWYPAKSAPKALQVCSPLHRVHPQGHQLEWQKLAKQSLCGGFGGRCYLTPCEPAVLAFAVAWSRRRFSAVPEVGEPLPSDEELSKSFNARLPAEVRIQKERALNAEETLRKADESIKALGIDLDKDARERKEMQQLLPSLRKAAVATCWPRQEKAVSSALREVSGDEVRVFETETLQDLAAEDFRQQLAGCCAVAVYCEQDLESQAQACAGLTALLEGVPESVQRIVLVADLPASPVERHLKRALRERSSNASPLRLSIIRANFAGQPMPGDGPQVIAKMPATVRDAARGLRSTLIGGVRSAANLAAAFQAREESLAVASPEAVAKVLHFALRRGIDVPEVSVVGSGEADLDERLLPLVGPELWRLDVPDGRRARVWVQGWVEFNYCRGANQNSAAMRRAGLKTPVEVRKTLQGVCIKFMPGSRRPGGFDGLLEGGLEILVDEATESRPARMRVRRCAYGWRKKPRESSERAILSRLRRDWEMSEKLRS
ncbi:unnamed protein product [Effrenium voratum]|nr:unnamed protein product [Effrenium voratum]